MSLIMADSISISISSSPSSTLLLNPNASPSSPQPLVFDSSLLQDQQTLPKEFLWPNNDLTRSEQQLEDLNEPIVDLGGFVSGDVSAAARAAELVRAACLSHGFFQVTNHGVCPELIEAAYREVDRIFELPISRKLSMRRKPGGVIGYSGAHADRYSAKLPWKETFSFRFSGADNVKEKPTVVEYFKSVLGEDFQYSGRVYQRYCEAMKELSLMIMELLAMSLGVDRFHLREFFEDSSSIMRCNLYPPCRNEGLTMGTGPHCDPTSLTILHQDQVGGLQVFAYGRWQAVKPRHNAFVVNIGDTFMAMSNGLYKSCLHRAVVNRERERKSLVYFVSPREDKVVRPPPDLLLREGAIRQYPDFTWSDLFNFTQSHYRADVATLESFFEWFLSSNKPSKSNMAMT
ncbi:hypothetical protein SAY86_014185 [Trapa natans]|uniref:Fe2OG dioxygenase domain-containing protein n=1 Tax=Trapa natans TaxID=22666 RepID=A0AAN7KSU7_TRANT|nr:hypothetical protein SAY86_014185 [Trapa natans]